MYGGLSLNIFRCPEEDLFFRMSSCFASLVLKNSSSKMPNRWHFSEWFACDNSEDFGFKFHLVSFC